MLILFALLLVAASLFVSNSIVQRVHQREKNRATQWADAIQKKIELVELTDSTFSRLRAKEREKMQLWIEATKELSKMSTNLDSPADYSFPLQIINQNKDIPVILVDDERNVSGYINLDFDTLDLRQQRPDLAPAQLRKNFEDSLLKLSRIWSQTNAPFTIEVYEGLFMTYYYTDSKLIRDLERDRDSLINSFSRELINNDGLIPVLLIDDSDSSILGSNLSLEGLTPEERNRTLEQFKKANAPIKMTFSNKKQFSLYYLQSEELTQLKYFPLIQFLVVGLFVLIGYLIFSTFRKAEQNKVWAGMAKETAHQLGTPISSLMAWTELLAAQEVDPTYLEEMNKDLERLRKVSERFSKIGSETTLESGDLNGTIQRVVEYFRTRISDKIQLEFEKGERLDVKHNAPLIEWVFENLIKNSVDAIEHSGKISIRFKVVGKRCWIDVEDNGKGIAKKDLKNVFQPGYSTKKRGWGLGLSLVRRIIHEYHKGKIYVLHSQQNKGTTFRIELPL